MHSINTARRNTQSDVRRATRDKIIQVLHGRIQQGHLDEDEDLEALADPLAGDYIGIHLSSPNSAQFFVL